MFETAWLDPAKIRFKISPVADLAGRRADGDWDVQRRYPFERTVKHRSIVQRFTEGRRWEDTDLFRDVYARRFEDDSEVRGAGSIEELAAQYYERIDGLHDSMKRDGFRIEDDDGREISLPGLLIGRAGEVFIGNQGNHRVSIALVIGLSKIAGKIICKHTLS